jgi:hypothetical protein
MRAAARLAAGCSTAETPALRCGRWYASRTGPTRLVEATGLLLSDASFWCQGHRLTELEMVEPMEWAGNARCLG